MRNILLFVVLLMPLLTFSQEDVKKESFQDKKRLFRAYVVAGANFNQIDGDRSGGYNSIGVNGGGGVFVTYTKKFSNSLEITYSMRGAKSNAFKAATTAGTFTYQTDYIDIPVLFNYHDFKVAIFQGGFSYTQMVRSKFQGNPIPASNDNLYKWNIDAVVGVTFLIKNHWGLNFKYNYSLLNNLKKFDSSGDRLPRGGLIGPQSAKNSNRGINGGSNWYHNVLTFRLMYVI